MSPGPLRVEDADVHAYADGRLDGERTAAFDALAVRDPAFAATVAGIRAQSDALRAALDPVLNEPIPERLLQLAAPPARPDATARLRRHLPGLAAAAMLVIGVALGWFTRGYEIERGGTPTSYARQVAFTHALYAADVNRPVEIWAAEEKRLVTWLTKRLGHPVHAPDLNQFGYALVGGRLVAGNEKPAALFMYENADRQRLSLQVRRTQEHGDAAFRFAVENGVAIFYWIDDAFSYALSGNLDRTALLAIARLVYGQLAAADASRQATP